MLGAGSWHSPSNPASRAGRLQPCRVDLPGMLLALGPCVGSHLLEAEIPLPGDVQGWEQVSNQPHEDGQVVCYDLGDVEVSQSSHQDLILSTARVPPLQGAGYHQHGLDSPQTPVVVVLPTGSKVSQLHLGEGEQL